MVMSNLGLEPPGVTVAVGALVQVRHLVDDGRGSPETFSP